MGPKQTQRSPGTGNWIPTVAECYPSVDFIPRGEADRLVLKKWWRVGVKAVYTASFRGRRIRSLSNLCWSPHTGQSQVITLEGTCVSRCFHTAFNSFNQNTITWRLHLAPASCQSLILSAWASNLNKIKTPVSPFLHYSYSFMELPCCKTFVIKFNQCKCRLTCHHHASRRVGEILMGAWTEDRISFPNYNPAEE